MLNSLCEKYYFAENMSNVLQEGRIQVFPQSECKRIYKYEAINQGIICGGRRQGGVDSCKVTLNYRKSNISIVWVIIKKLKYSVSIAGRFWWTTHAKKEGKIFHCWNSFLGLWMWAEKISRNLHSSELLFTLDNRKCF